MISTISTTDPAIGTTESGVCASRFASEPIVSLAGGTWYGACVGDARVSWIVVGAGGQKWCEW